MIRLLASLLLAAVAAVATWFWLGAEVAMPRSPLTASGKLPCVSYAPFRGAQSPLDGGTYIDAAQIDDDFARLSKITSCVRTYSSELGMEAVPRLAAKHGMTVLQGTWIGGNPKKNAIEIERTVALVKAHPDTITAVIVGNEVLLRGEMGPNDLAETIRRVRERVNVPVTYADVWEFWIRHRSIERAVDFVTIHILPYWEDQPVGALDAAQHVDAIRQKVAAIFPDKEILIGETGWPSSGRMRDGALPSPSSQARVLHDLLALARLQDYRVNLIEAFDQPWKRRLEGTAGGFWGLIDGEARTPKFAWGRPVSDHPWWRWQIAGGLAMILAIGAAVAAAAAPPLSAPRLLGLASLAYASALGVPLAAEVLPLQSFTWGGWLRNSALVAAAVTAGPLAAVVVARRLAVPRFATILDPLRRQGTRRAELAVGMLLIVATILALISASGLMFDPRYKDFPFAGLTAIVIPLAVATMAGLRRDRGEGIAEAVAAAALAVAAVFVGFNETPANWQALWTAGLWLLLAVSLLRVRGGWGARS